MQNITVIWDWTGPRLLHSPLPQTAIAPLMGHLPYSKPKCAGSYGVPLDYTKTQTLYANPYPSQKTTS